MEKRFVAIVGVIIAIFVGVVVFSSNQDAKEESASSKSQPTSHIKGNKDSKVKLVEYSDFQCPFCGQYFPIVEQVVGKYESQISFQYRHYPLSQLHQNAVSAARASEAADKQGKFWEMYQLLFQNQASWSDSKNVGTVFEGYAKQLGLNTAKFKTDFASKRVNDSINADRKEFQKTGFQESTPTFVLNGKRIQPTSVEEFSKLIDEALKK